MVLKACNITNFANFQNVVSLQKLTNLDQMSCNWLDINPSYDMYDVCISCYMIPDHRRCSEVSEIGFGFWISLFSFMGNFWLCTPNFYIFLKTSTKLNKMHGSCFLKPNYANSIKHPFSSWMIFINNFLVYKVEYVPTTFQNYKKL